MTDPPAEVALSVEAAPPDDDPRWQRLHARSALVVAGGAVGSGAALLARVFREALDDAGTWSAALHEPALRWATAGIVLLVVAVSAGGWVSVRRRGYALTPGALHVRSGLVTRTRTTVRVSKIQAVDVGLPLPARVVGLTRLDVRPGDGAATVTLAYLRPEEAEALRTRLLGPGTDERGQEVVVVPMSRARRAVRRSLGVWGAAVGVLGAAVLMVADIVTSAVRLPLVSGGVLLLGGALVHLGSAVFGVLERAAGFRLARDGELLRVAHGIANRSRRTLRRSRVQGLTISRWRPWNTPGWWSVQAVMASDQGSDDDDANGVLVPIATPEEAVRAATVAVPAVPGDLLAAFLAAPGRMPDGAGVIRPPVRARWRAPVGSRRHAVADAEHVLVAARGGIVRREVAVVVHGRTEALAISQGWLQRRLRLATLTLHQPGTASTQVPHLDVDDARRLLRTLAAREGRRRTDAT
ncbi:membrane-flanked domain protein [Xylanimonas cellulosilytica DSM 15894]|uniref:Membrane-flanked domain protein n=1 Tax=Xylanimonas cellulosilytica (strain DSM 15894 / JCM 12276 / CECT 5975 / KCTC 9989 / LMG 20990 / NBRC 107835 / XIL07) TaxID=446471 RepID=D1BZ90_XYLCX|nr:PH domain-containing protein [Xylanimonas cellulosilytica]ACZ31987.1 membrane-flanked domain protein [Xylanimonas cellulosilytica DSM 15894]